MLDLVDDARPSPASVDLVQQRAGWIVEPRRGRLLRLQIVPFKAGPALKGVVVPRAACHVLIEVKVAVGEDVEPSALLITYHDRQRVLKLLAKADIEHAGVERAAPHAYVEPARPWKRARDSARKYQVGGGGEHGFLRSALYIDS